MHDIYEFITKNSFLSNEHRSELKEKRGFSQKTINDLRFFSGGDYIKEIVSKIDKKILIDSGICYESGEINKGLVDGRIVIPYLDGSSKAIMLRPHKSGLKDVGSMIYDCRIHSRKFVIICEGEFKAAAMMQLGYDAISTQGISTFSVSKIQELIPYIKSYEAAIIMFDNEIKDNPKYSNFKSEPMNRYDTQYYSWLLCYELNREKIKCLIATLPNKWMIGGKVDCDSALANGKDEDDFDRVIKSAVTYNKYRESFSGEAAKIIEKKIERKFLKEKIKIENCAYLKKIKTGENSFWVPISNFIINLISIYETPYGIIREIVFEKSGIKSDPVKITKILSLDSFKDFCSSMGPYLFKGSGSDLVDVWEYILLTGSEKHIIEKEYIGRLDKSDTWIFSNIGVKKKETIERDDSGVVWIDGVGYKPSSIIEGASVDDSIDIGMPYIHTEGISNIELYENLSDKIGRTEAALSLGWASACVYMRDIFKISRGFPFLFVFGERGSGKSTIAEWIMHIFGIESNGKMAADSSAVSIQRYLTYYSSLPLYIDEYRNDERVTKKDNTFRSAYNFQSAGKGLQYDKYKVREGIVRGTLLICGEVTPNDNALYSRCVVVDINEKKRKNHSTEWFDKNKLYFSSYFYDCLINRNYNEYLNAYKIIKDTYSDVDIRTQNNYAICIAGFYMAFGNELTNNIAEEVHEYIHTSFQEIENDSQIAKFWEDITKIENVKSLIEYDGVELKMYIGRIYDEWAEYCRRKRNEHSFKFEAISKYLKKEKSFLRTEKCYMSRLKQTKHCYVFRGKDLDETIISAFID